MINKNYKFLSQEALKGIACGIMLLDHIGVITQSYTLRMIGRMAFPIFCFLISEGAFYTRNAKMYGLRLAIFAVLSEIPYDLFVGTGWSNQNVLFTLLFGFAAISCSKLAKSKLLKILVVLVCAVLAELVRGDYGAVGVLLIVVFSLAKSHAVFQYWLPGIFAYGLEHFPTAVLSLAPIACYNGRKISLHRWSRWSFYLFYPVHMLVLALVKFVM